MAFGFAQTSYEAVMFLNGNDVVKEMLYSEFEAVLDGIVGEPEFAGEACNAVFMKVDTRLNILGAVFFCIEFDGSGAADRRWNLPLSQLADTAAFGPSQNGIQIRVACRSQCQIPWHQEHLWEPDLSSTSNLFKKLDASIKRNRLGLLVEKSATSEEQAHPQEGIDGQHASPAKPTAGSDDHDEKTPASIEQERQRMAQNIKKQRLYIASLKTRHEQELESVRVEHSCEKEVLMAKIDELNLSWQASDRYGQQMAEELENLREEISGSQQAHEKHMAETLNKQGLDFSALRKQFRQEMQQKVIEQTSELRSKLEMREVEAHYRDEQILRLNRELEESRSQKVLKPSANVGSALAELDKMGIHFVLTLPGIGPLKIAVSDIDEYRSDPNAYTANRLGVELPLYEAWLENAQHPVCKAEITDECQCDKPIDIVAPKEFVAGISDRCAQHSEAANQTPLNVVGG